jgi:osmotically-inducible protein OsmY
MVSPTDARIEHEIRHLYERNELPIAADVRDGVVRLTGVVSSREMYEAVLELARSINDVLEIDPVLEYGVIAPDSIVEALDEDREFGYADQTALQDDISDTEPDFIAQTPAIADDYRPVMDDAEPYSPPIDPVVQPGEKSGELRVVGGFQLTSMDELAVEQDTESGGEIGEPDLLVDWEDFVDEANWYVNRDDADIKDDILRELREDALTTDLKLQVSVTKGVVFLRGAVPASEDALAAEDVASRVPGVVEVRDKTRTISS